MHRYPNCTTTSDSRCASPSCSSTLRRRRRSLAIAGLKLHELLRGTSARTGVPLIGARPPERRRGRDVSFSVCSRSALNLWSPIRIRIGITVAPRPEVSHAFVIEARWRWITRAGRGGTGAGTWAIPSTPEEADASGPYRVAVVGSVHSGHTLCQSSPVLKINTGHWPVSCLNSCGVVFCEGAGHEYCKT